MSYLTRREVQKLLRIDNDTMAKFIQRLDFPRPFRIVGEQHEIWSRDELNLWLDNMRERFSN